VTTFPGFTLPRELVALREQVRRIVRDEAGLLRAISLREQVPHTDIDELARQAHQSADAAEGRRAMLEKRKPVFRGE
jgi:hypothetical protein